MEEQENIKRNEQYIYLKQKEEKVDGKPKDEHEPEDEVKANIARYQELFRKRKDRYRRWRDLSFFVMVGVYALSVVDAYVDASLSEFDISDDLTLEVAPAVMGNPTALNPYKPTGIGLQCSLTF